MDKNYSKPQVIFLVVLRVLIGWHFLYEGISKILKPNWSSIGYLMDSQGFMSGFFHWIAENPGILNTADILNTYGLTAVGAGLLLGIFTRISTIAGIFILTLYYLSHPPFIGAQYLLPTEGNYLWVDKNLIEIAALMVMLYFPTGHIIGLDKFICKSK
jgi:thiosulfate dehydrogenase [quinone] large subunit